MSERKLFAHPALGAPYEMKTEDGQYMCNCGRVFKQPLERTAHAATCDGKISQEALEEAALKNLENFGAPEVLEFPDEESYLKFHDQVMKRNSDGSGSGSKS